MQTASKESVSARSMEDMNGCDDVNIQGGANVLAERDPVVVWDVPFDAVTQTEAVDRIGELIRRRKPSYVITANLNYVMLHAQSDEVKEVTLGASLILADGQPIVWKSKMGPRPLPVRVAGSEMIYELAERASREGWRIYFMGGMPGVAQKTSDRLVEAYPGLQVAGVESPPFRTLSETEQREQDDRIRDARTDILLVAFGQPKGEQWIYDHCQRIGVPVSIQLGASFDFIAGTAKRAPAIYQKFGMEWAYRMLSDPSRLVPRYASNIRFLLTSMWS
ncbi:putative N-acetylmannosaminyltransferase [Rubripirellula tenax]|uniref:Putative N-acetylmannosaminyltransferase n=1 Tax=Rubripirellula tenax TaxID=2528015 RepID=A0A5C6F8D0_9BACT|nr:WecB/TagA/CpsF family glycosyltransferase [Rubripirellula tenax]TWU56870.1 putative N-acetylmannosaminyltransferase [Rubripirellula tenax]